MAEEITPDLQNAKCLSCGKGSVIISLKEFPYQVMDGRKTLAVGVLETYTTICLECHKAFVSEASLPPRFINDLIAGRLKIYNHTGMKILVISDQPFPYAQTI